MAIRVLVADDDGDLRFLIEMSLSDSGCDVVCVSNGREVLDAVSREAFDVILLDAEMPVMDGFEAYRALRSGPQTANIPVVFLTARPPDQALRDLGSSFHYILKPFDADALPETIRKIAAKQ